MSSEPPVRTDLSRRACSERLLSDLAALAHAARLFVPFARLRDLSERLLERRLPGAPYARRVRLDATALGALARAHAAAQARLLREALELALRSLPEGRAWTGPELRPPSLEAWYEDADAELERALRDGLTVEGELLACLLDGPPSWTVPRELAGAAQRLDPTGPGAVAVARAACFAGADPGDVDGLLAVALAPRDRARLHQALGLAAEARGDGARALVHLERALAAAPGARAALAMWVLAGERDDAAAGEAAWRVLAATTRGRAGLDVAQAERLWRELMEHRAHRGLATTGPLLRGRRAAWLEEAAR